MTYGYSSKSTHLDLSNESQHDRVKMVFKNRCALDKSILSIGGVKKRFHLLCVRAYFFYFFQFVVVVECHLFDPLFSSKPQIGALLAGMGIDDT